MFNLFSEFKSFLELAQRLCVSVCHLLGFFKKIVLCLSVCSSFFRSSHRFSIALSLSVRLFMTKPNYVSGEGPRERHETARAYVKQDFDRV